MNWTIDTAHTAVTFSVKHMMVSTARGKFDKVTGKGFFNDADPSNAYIEVDIDAASINTGDEKRDGHLRSADFLDAEKYPTLTFKSTKVEKVNDEKYKITGDLTIKDVTKEVVLDTEYGGQGKNPWGMTIAGFSARTSINRKDFGLNWNVALETGGVLVSEKVNIDIEVELVQQAAVAAQA
jgi:polyisoprenoid-binding protein YceI